MSELKCEAKGCTTVNPVAFVSPTPWGSLRRYCGTCYGHRYGPEICEVCERGCYEEDLINGHFICGACPREQKQ